MDNLVTAKEVSEYLKLSEATVYKLASDGNLPGYKIGKSWRFDMEEVLEEIMKSKGQKKIKTENDN